MNKVYVLPPSEDWIVDRFVKEWNEDNKDISVLSPNDADVVWLLADWCWEQLFFKGLLKNKKVLTTVHHIVPEKFKDIDVHNFLLRDKITTAYHVYNEQTLNFIRKFTSKPIHLLKYWANQNIWYQTEKKEILRKKYNLPENGFLVGSFQRDTEGKDLISPKLEKGPDLLADALESWAKEKQNLHVVLAGWRRQYIISRLTSKNIPFSYFDRPDQKTINDLYQTLDLYPVTARCEGGPQSLIECGLLNIPVISRDIGIASQVLPQESINDNVILATPNIPNIEEWKLPKGYQKYRDLIINL
jgi:glycosyltransferase involved in cell wall biosynthesis